MAKATLIEEVDATEEVEETVAIVRPADLAKALGINPKALRNFLRSEFPRPLSEKNTSWVLTKAQVDAATAYFTAADEEVDEDGEILDLDSE